MWEFCGVGNILLGMKMQIIHWFTLSFSQLIHWENIKQQKASHFYTEILCVKLKSNASRRKLKDCEEVLLINLFNQVHLKPNCKNVTCHPQIQWFRMQTEDFGEILYGITFRKLNKTNFQKRTEWLGHLSLLTEMDR